MQNLSEAPPLAGQAESPSSGLVKSLRSPLTLGLVSCGGVGAFLFTATYLFEGITRPGYSAWQQPISALSLGPGGWVQQVNFVVFGLLTLLKERFSAYRDLVAGTRNVCPWCLSGLSAAKLIVVRQRYD